MSRFAVLALILAACGPKDPPQRPCAESQEKRAAGEYLERSGGHHAYQVYAPRCFQRCETGDQGACAEARLLAVEHWWPQNVTLDDITSIEALCASGHATACAWLEDEEHQEEIARVRWRYEAVASGPSSGGDTPIARAAAALAGVASSNGQSLLQGATYSLVGTSSISFEVDGLVAGRAYVLALVADRAMTFTARVHGPASSIDLSETYVSDDAFVRASNLSWDVDSSSTASISIHADGSERGDVRFLLFGTD